MERYAMTGPLDIAPAAHRRIAAWIGLLGVFVALAASLPARSATTSTDDTPTLLIVVGAPGEADYATNFVQQAARWEKVGEQAGAKRTTFGIGDAGTTNDIALLRSAIAAEPTEGTSALWIVLIGHGTYDGRDAKFNLRGPDLAATDLALWLKPFHRPVAVIDTSSASGPFLKPLSAPGRVVVTATRSGNEQSFARFGGSLADAIADPASDLDQDGQTSLLEAFLSASAKVAEFYKTADRLATEHALIDDNGDGLGTPADWFRGTRATKKAKDGQALDGLRARQLHLVRSPDEQSMDPAVRSRCDELERAIEKHREARPKMSDDEYFRGLEVLLREIARLRVAPASDPAR